jgi:hypothetical protein
VTLPAYAPLASPAFTGDPTAPTATFGDNDTSISTTAFVQAALAGGTAVAKNLEVYVRNQSGSTIAAGSIVYISGATGNRPLITLAQANNDANSAQTIGFVKTSIANNGFGYVIVRGELENIDTSALTEGAQLYLSPTTAGTWTTTKPSAPQHLVYVGIVIRSHPTLGTILVAVQNGYELGEIHDVALSSPANNDLLAYESATDLWKNKSFSTLGLLTSADAATTYYPLTGNPSGFLTSASLSGYAQLSGATFTGLVSTPASTTASAGFRIVQGVAPTSPTNGDVWQDGTNLNVRIAGATQVIPALGSANTYTATNAYTGTISHTGTVGSLGSGSIAMTISLAAGLTPSGSTKTVNIGNNSQAGSTTTITIGSTAGSSTTTLNGKVSTAAATATGAPFNIPNGTTPTSNLVNGDLWTTTGGVFTRINGNSLQLADTASGLSYSGNNTFTGPTLVFGNTTATSSVNIASGANTAATTKTVNVGTGGLASSTTNITIGSAAGNSTTTLQGTTNGVTAAADTNTTQIATTAFVIGQASASTPLSDGTAAVGTSMKYARADHVHPTDTTRLATANNLSELTATASTARTNLGLGTAATASSAQLIPSGGTTGQVLSKVDGTDYNVTWSTASGGGSSTDYQAYTTAGTYTWTKPANAKWVEIYLIGGGGGGGSGSRFATSSARSGGAGGGSGGFLLTSVAASALGATESVVVGAGGAGGVSRTTDTNNGFVGSAGGNTTFSIFTALGNVGGSPGSTAASTQVTGRTGWIRGTSSPSPTGNSGPGGVGAGTAAGNILSQNAFAPTGGGGGAGSPAASTAPNPGGNGGGKTAPTGAQCGIGGVAGGSGGTTGGTLPTVGVAGNTIRGGGTGGGGGAYITGVAGMAGAAGAAPGGGGGGGAASDNGFDSGAGGAGGAGVAYIITYC